MIRERKEAFVEGFRERVQETDAILLTDFTGLGVKQMTTLRSQLKKSGGEFLVVKNRLVKRALADTEMPDISGHLEGPTGVVFGDSEVVAAVAKTIRDFARENEDRPALKVGVLASEVLDPDAIRRLAELPSREELLAQMAGALSAPTAALLTAIQGKLQEMAGLVEALQGERDRER
ncbi:MAG: 50S ribosomal protein L10 [Gemmatimonadetes bacterium]|nr:50S ribosomal protein L10 [Gemmatimonadota bacterium]MCY3942663.1 50S ribosomal protein L10 [Gemmatimonadota bacterium]